jgi:uncharacterized repeat protein (TIGR01451 family)
MLSPFAKRAALSLTSAVGLVLCASATAGASVTIGQTAGASNSCGSDQVLLQAATAGAPSYAAPSSGVVVSWSYGATTDNSNITFKVYHATANPQVWFVRSASAEKNPGAGAGQIHPNAVNTFAESPGLPIQTGDVLGLSGRLGSGISCIAPTASADHIRVKNPPDPPPGSDSPGFIGDNPMQKLAVSAVIEPDADGDQFGDESQDSCPTDPAVHAAACPVDVQVVKTASANPTVGSDLTYTLAVANNNAGNPAGGVTVTDALPSGVTFVSSSAGQGSCTGTATVSCALGTIGPSQSTTVSIVVKPTAEGPLSNTATVTTSAADTNNANDSSTAATTVAPAPVITPPLPKLSGLRLSPASFLAAKGTFVSYTNSQKSKTTFTALRRQSGVKKGKRCVAPPRKSSGRKPKRCTRYVSRGTFSHNDNGGAVRFHFSARVKGKKLPPGRYRLKAVARNLTGASKPVTANFKVKKP